MALQYGAQGFCNVYLLLWLLFDDVEGHIIHKTRLLRYMRKELVGEKDMLTGTMFPDDGPSQKPVAALQVRLHPGVIIAVVVVSSLAILAACFIIRKYCCLRSNAAYRYSELREQEEQHTADELDNSSADRMLYNDDSDEDLLE